MSDLNDNVEIELLERFHLSYRIRCSVCNSICIAYYDESYNGYLAYCEICDDQWKLS